MQAKRQEVRGDTAQPTNWTEPDRDENGQIYCPGANCGQKLKNLHSYQRHVTAIHSQQHLFGERAKVSSTTVMFVVKNYVLSLETGRLSNWSVL